MNYFIFTFFILLAFTFGVNQESKNFICGTWQSSGFAKFILNFAAELEASETSTENGKIYSQSNRYDIFDQSTVFFTDERYAEANVKMEAKVKS
jgi:hypothetical protein